MYTKGPEFVMDSYAMCIIFDPEDVEICTVFASDADALLSHLNK